MNLTQLKKVVAKGETDCIEFKKSTSLLNDVFETVCAFLNGCGGIVLIGVGNNGKIIGQEVSDATRREIAHKVSQLEPSAQSLISVDYIPIAEKNNVIAISIDAGPHIPYVYGGRPYQRIQNTTSKMSQHQYEQLLVKRGQLNYIWDEQPAIGYRIEDLDQEEIRRTVKDAIDTGRLAVETSSYSIEEILHELNLIKDEHLINAAVVLFAKKINLPYMHCLIRMNRYRGADKLGGFIDSKRIHGNAFQILSEANYFSMRHLSIAGFFESGNARRLDKPIVPVMAIREALINAITHRDYANKSASISFEIYSDRLEIWNNGMLPPQLKISDLKKRHNSFPRNQRIADVFYIRKWVETAGVGTLRMIAECKQLGTPAPKFEEYSGGVSVTFQFKEPMGIVTKSTKKKIELSQRQENILALIKKHKFAKIKQIIAGLENPPSRRMVAKDLNYLKQQKLVYVKGKTTNAVWILQ